MSNLQFDNLRWLGLLWIVLGVALVAVYGVWQRHRALRMFASPHLIGHLSPPIGWLRPLMRIVLVLLCLCALVAALIGPRWGEQEQKVARRNIDMMVLLDVSRSMLARDIAPNRLDRAKLSIRDDLLPALGGDQVGLIAFAGATARVCPLTNDYGFFRLALEEVSPKSVPRGGTLIGDAIRKAADSFPEKIGAHKIILLITDGEDQESYPVQAAANVWNDRHIPIVAVALGDEREGARIPIEGERGEKYLEYEGQTVWSKANFDDLRKVAEVEGGDVFARAGRQNFVPVGTRNFDLGDVYRRVVLPAIDAQEQLESQTVPLPARYHVFALAALALLLLDSVLPDGPRRAPGALVTSKSERGMAA